MGYVEKKELMEALAIDGGFTDEELSYIEEILSEDKLYNDTVLSLINIEDFEKKGLLKRFYKVCEKRYYFPQWVENVKKRIDHVL